MCLTESPAANYLGPSCCLRTACFQVQWCLHAHRRQLNESGARDLACVEKVNPEMADQAHTCAGLHQDLPLAIVYSFSTQGSFLSSLFSRFSTKTPFLCFFSPEHSFFCVSYPGQGSG